MLFVLNERHLPITRESSWILLPLRFKRLMAVNLYRVSGTLGRSFPDKSMSKSQVSTLF